MFVAVHSLAFVARVGFAAPSEARLVLVVKDERDLHEAVKQLAVVGYDRVVGFLEGGMSAWQEAGLPVQQVSQLSVEELSTYRHALTILDVRDQAEWDEGHIAGAIHLPSTRCTNLTEPDPLAVICASGQRSMIASALLQRQGFTAVANGVGGMEAWNQVQGNRQQGEGTKRKLSHDEVGVSHPILKSVRSALSGPPTHPSFGSPSAGGKNGAYHHERT